MEVLETNEDIHREEVKKIQKQTDDYNKISDEQKGETISAALGLDTLIQTDQNVVNGKIFSSSAENPDDSESLTDLAKNARETADNEAKEALELAKKQNIEVKNETTSTQSIA